MFKDSGSRLNFLGLSFTYSKSRTNGTYKMLITFFSPMSIDAAGPRTIRMRHIHIAAAACGTRMDQAIVMVKSAAVMTNTHITAHLFTDNEKVLRDKLNTEVRSIQYFQDKTRRVFSKC